jgi:hypothetical protein
MVCSCASVNAVHVPSLLSFWSLVVSSAIWSSGRRFISSQHICSEGHTLWCKCSWRRRAQDHVFHPCTTQHGRLWPQHSTLLVWACEGYQSFFSLNNLFMQMLCSTDPVRTLSISTGVKNYHCRMQIW